MFQYVPSELENWSLFKIVRWLQLQSVSQWNTSFSKHPTKKSAEWSQSPAAADPPFEVIKKINNTQWESSLRQITLRPRPKTCFSCWRSDSDCTVKLDGAYILIFQPQYRHLWVLSTFSSRACRTTGAFLFFLLQANWTPQLQENQDTKWKIQSFIAIKSKRTKVRSRWARWGGDEWHCLALKMFPDMNELKLLLAGRRGKSSSQHFTFWHQHYWLYRGKSVVNESSTRSTELGSDPHT